MSTVTMLIDETIAKAPSKFAAVCVAIVDDAEAAGAYLDQVRDGLLVDPYYRDIPSVLTSLREHGFHYSQDTIDVRTKGIQALQQLPFEAYIAFTDQAVVDSGYAWYDDLLSKILFDRLCENANTQIRIVAEIHGEPHLRRKRLNELVSGLVAQAEGRLGLRFVSPPSIELGDKKRSYLAIADYSVGAFRDYWLKGRHSKASIEARQFRELSARIRVVLDAESGVRYWRDNPLPSR